MPPERRAGSRRIPTYDMDATYIIDSLPGTFLTYGITMQRFRDDKRAATKSTCSRGRLFSDTILK